MRAAMHKLCMHRPSLSHISTFHDTKPPKLTEGVSEDAAFRPEEKNRQWEGKPTGDDNGQSCQGEDPTGDLW